MAVFGCYSGQFIRQPWIKWEDAIEEIPMLQSQFNWDPKNPKTIVGSLLFKSVQFELKPRYAQKLEFYCTIGTALDFWHKTDGIFVVSPFVVCIDLKTYNKTSESSDSINVTPANENWNIHFTAIAKEIAKIFNKQIKKSYRKIN